MGRAAWRTLGLIAVAATGGLGANAALAAPPPVTTYFIEADAGARDPRISLQIEDGETVRDARLATRIACHFRDDGRTRHKRFSLRIGFQPAPVERNGRFISERRQGGFHTVIAGQVREDGIRGRTRVDLNRPDFNCDTGRIPFGLEQVSAERFERYRSHRPRGRDLARALRSAEG